MGRGEVCYGCLGKGYRYDWTADTPCPDCNGTGKSPAITAAEEVLKMASDERKRVERLRELDWNAIGNAMLYVSQYHVSPSSRQHAKKLNEELMDALNAPVKEENDDND